jgi:inhibitor of cysteine peptidase
MRARAWPGALALGAVLLSAATSARAAIQTVVIGELYDGGTVNLGAGDTLEIDLPAPAAGYAWVPAFGDDTILRPDPASATPKFRYHALVTGSTSIGLACLKAADSQAPPAGLFRVQVAVKDSVMPRGILLEPPDSGSDIFLVQGDLLQVKLPSTPSTGYSWTISGNAPSVLRPTGDPKYDPPAKGSPGAAGTQTFEFRVVGGGGAFLDLVYRRGFEKDAPPARRWGVFVASAAVGP